MKKTIIRDVFTNEIVDSFPDRPSRNPAIRVFTTDGVDERSSVSELFEDEIIVDSFAGGGGASHGIEMAFGRGPDIAINHDAEAICLHKANHPNTEHYIENVWRVDPVIACRGRRVGLMWLSPDCKHFSKAKGGKPVSKKIRGLAWVAVRWAVAVRPRVIVLENVEEFQTWGPVLPSGQPCPARKGRTFKAFVRKLEKLGYQVEWRELRASYYNTPTIRKRLFVIARCDGQPIIWPEEENGPKVGIPERAAAECIDWDIEGTSIFEREALGLKPLAPNTMRRIARGIKRFVLDNPSPFIVGVGGRMGQSPEKSVISPMNTITAKGDSAIVMPHITKFRANSVGSEITEPMHTVTSNGHNTKRPGCAIPLGLVEATAIPFVVSNMNNNVPSGIDQPVPTVTSGNKNYLTTPLLVPTAHQGDARGHQVTEPMRTICGKRGDSAIITPVIVRAAHGEQDSKGRKRGKGEHSIEEPLGSVLASNEFGIIAPTLIQRYGERVGQEPRCNSVEEPMNTVVPTGNGANLVTAFMAQHNTGLVGHTMEEPLSTIVQKGCTQALVETAFVSKMYGTTTGQEVTEPLHTVTANGKGGGHFAAVAAFLVSYYNTDQNTGNVRDPIATVTPKERFGLVTTTINGAEYVIADIKMRMLQPRELYRAQGFPDTYKIEVPFDYVVTRVVNVRTKDGKIKRMKNGKPKKRKMKMIVTKPLTKTAQVRMCGNSVCPPLARAILAANFAQRDARRQERVA